MCIGDLQAIEYGNHKVGTLSQILLLFASDNAILILTLIYFN